MSDYRFTDESATAIVLAALVRDMKSALDWLAIGLAGASFYATIGALKDGFAHHWLGLAFNVATAAWLGFGAFDLARRSDHYHPPTRRELFEAAKEAKR